MVQNLVTVQLLKVTNLHLNYEIIHNAHQPVLNPILLFPTMFLTTFITVKHAMERAEELRTDQISDPTVTVTVRDLICPQLFCVFHCVLPVHIVFLLVLVESFPTRPSMH